ncbi:protein of unknown function [Pseudomonas sp. JV551A1]|nr:protein of unknown function [Pseudomonas sp. JV551A1]
MIDPNENARHGAGRCLRCRSGVRVTQLQGAALAAQLAVEVFQRVIELGGGTIDRLVQRSGGVGHGNRLVAFGASLHLAAFVMRSGLGAVLVAQVNLDAGEVVFVTFQRVLQCAADPLVEPGVAFEMVAAVDLDLHDSILIQLARMETRLGL